jgi:hypothetical protein
VVINIKVNKETHPGSFRWKSITVAPPEEGMSVLCGTFKLTMKFSIRNKV